MQNADDFIGLMKQKADALLASDENLQKFLYWVNQKSRAVNYTRYKIAAIRAFYFALDRPPDKAFDLAYSLDSSLQDGLYDCRIFGCNSYSAIYLYSLVVDRDLSIVHNYYTQDWFKYGHSSYFNRLILFSEQIELPKIIQEITYTYPILEKDAKGIKKLWYKLRCYFWGWQLREVMIKYRNIGHDWQFSKEQKELLQQYYDANKLLVDCMNSSDVSYELRQEIEDTLLLPIAEIEKYKTNKLCE